MSLFLIFLPVSYLHSFPVHFSNNQKMRLVFIVIVHVRLSVLRWQDERTIIIFYPKSSVYRKLEITCNCFASSFFVPKAFLTNVFSFSFSMYQPPLSVCFSFLSLFCFPLIFYLTVVIFLFTSSFDAFCLKQLTFLFFKK